MEREQNALSLETLSDTYAEMLLASDVFKTDKTQNLAFDYILGLMNQ